MKNMKTLRVKMVGLLATALILFSAFRADKPVITIFMIGDSTMANKKIDGGNPERGWGMVLPGFFSEDIRIDNHAANGRSSKSFISEGRWEKVISKEERNTETLQYTVRKVYRALKDTEEYISRRYNYIDPLLPDDIFFITTQELEDLYPDLTTKEREKAITKEKGAVFISKIGGVLASGERHDGRAPDYDDWELNGDIIVYYPVLDIGLELSSMGIRVDEDSLKAQLKEAGCEDRAELPFQKALLNGELPYTVGGGIGQSRICMFFLRKAHIGEVQCSLWSDEVMETAEKNGLQLL